MTKFRGSWVVGVGVGVGVGKSRGFQTSPPPQIICDLHINNDEKCALYKRKTLTTGQKETLIRAKKFHIDHGTQTSDTAQRQLS